jgi:PIN domain nuclease of toxin-antitoxin system
VAKFVLDTHALLWFLADDPKLGPAVDAAFDDPGSELILPAIALAEALWIASSRQQLQLAPKDLLFAIQSDPRVSVYPLTQELVEIAHGLSGISEMHDRQIVAATLYLSAHAEKAILLTRDTEITQSGVVPVAW